jgi:hypothetical protein
LRRRRRMPISSSSCYPYSSIKMMKIIKNKKMMLIMIMTI